MSLVDIKPTCPEGYELRCVQKGADAPEVSQERANVLVDKLNVALSRAETAEGCARRFEEDAIRFEQKLKAVNDAYDAMRAEKNATISLWQHRAEAMADPRADSFFTEDEVAWRSKGLAAVEANGWMRPEQHQMLDEAIRNCREVQGLTAEANGNLKREVERLKSKVSQLEAALPRIPFAADLEDP